MPHRPAPARRLAAAEKIDFQPWRIVAEIGGGVIALELYREPRVLEAADPAELEVMIVGAQDVAAAEAMELGIFAAARHENGPPLEIERHPHRARHGVGERDDAFAVERRGSHGGARHEEGRDESGRRQRAADATPDLAPPRHRNRSSSRSASGARARSTFQVAPPRPGAYRLFSNVSLKTSEPYDQTLGTYPPEHHQGRRRALCREGF